jgi:DNA mismatch repair protein MutS
MSTPMLTQVATLKREAGDAILFTRMGDFFELHGEDAVRAAPVLEIALTVRGRGTEFETPMCGVPHFALESYLPKLLAAGFSAAIAEPTARPDEVKGLLPRAITRIITPGTWLDDDARWLASVHQVGEHWGVALLQLASGQLRVIPGQGRELLAATLERLAPAELIRAEGAPDFDLEAARTQLPAWRFETERARGQILAFFGWTHLEGVGLDPYPAAIGALGALLDQVEATQKGRPAHIQGVSLELGAVGPLLDATCSRPGWTSRSGSGPPWSCAGGRWPGLPRTGTGSPCRNCWRPCPTWTASSAGWPWAWPRRPNWASSGRAWPGPRTCRA